MGKRTTGEPINLDPNFKPETRVTKTTIISREDWYREFNVSRGYYRLAGQS